MYFGDRQPNNWQRLHSEVLNLNRYTRFLPADGQGTGPAVYFGDAGSLQQTTDDCCLDQCMQILQMGKAQDLPVYFGDAGSPGVLHSIGAHRAACAVITLDTPGAS